jgi:hypothetical protein
MTKPSTMSLPLIKTHAALLTGAAQRDDHEVTRPEESMKGKVVKFAPC